MKKLWCDLRSDAERSDYILSGQAYDAGIIAHAIQADVAMAFHRCSEYDAEVRRLREENERQRFDILAMNQSLDLLREENERLRKDAERIEWQPIETAPKDGTDILVMTGETMHVVRWINIHGDFDYWAVDDNKHGPFTLRGKAPTHWMPLPETPK